MYLDLSSAHTRRVALSRFARIWATSASGIESFDSNHEQLGSALSTLGDFHGHWGSPDLWWVYIMENPLKNINDLGN